MRMSVSGSATITTSSRGRTLRYCWTILLATDTASITRLATFNSPHARCYPGGAGALPGPQRCALVRSSHLDSLLLIGGYADEVDRKARKNAADYDPIQTVGFPQNLVPDDCREGT